MTTTYPFDLATFQKAAGVMADAMFLKTMGTEAGHEDAGECEYEGAEIHVGRHLLTLDFANQIQDLVRVIGGDWELRVLRIDYDDALFVETKGNQEAMLKWLLEWTLQI